MAKIRKSPSHLLRVGTVYHFRYSIPRQFQRFVSGEIRVSLGTASLKAARIKAAKLTSLTQGYLTSVAEGRIVIEKKNQMKAALGQFLRKMLEKHELGRLDGPADSSVATTDGTRVEPELMLTYIGFDISDQLQQPVPTNNTKLKRKRLIRLSKAIKQFIKESVSDGKWAPKSIVEYENRLALLLAVMGDCLLS